MVRLRAVVLSVFSWHSLATDVPALVLMERSELDVPSLPSGWTASGQTPRSNTVELNFAVKQQGVKQLHDVLMDVSTPSSPSYGKHWSNEEVQRLTAPRAEHVAAVLSFLADHGVEGRAATPNSDQILATVSTELAEKMLSTEYLTLRHESGVEVSRALRGYSLPAAVAEAVDFVSPTVHVPGVRRRAALSSQAPSGRRRATAVTSAENVTDLGFNTPKNLRTLYNVNVEGKASGNKQAVTAFLEQGYYEPYLEDFWSSYCGGIHCGLGSPKLVGDATAGTAGTEAMLDIETITGIAGNVESEFWGFSGRSPDNDENEPFMTWLAQMSNTSDDDIPKIFSTSYGEDEGSWSYAAAQRLNVEFMKAGARGISLLYASGDEGANCKGGVFVPEGPGSSPYVTAVGGTQGTWSWPQPGAETATGLSSGGFSNYWPMPDYQKSAVAAYLQQSGLPDTSYGYNTSGRAYPDISAQATNFIVKTLIWIPAVSGTSCATPTASGIFTLLNDLRMQNGGSPLGFLNPLIYENAAAFNDITTGSSNSCGGWPAKAGWDAVTGVGTPDFAKLAQVVAPSTLVV
jgi:tripeptidyl-peptidase-1